MSVPLPSRLRQRTCRSCTPFASAPPSSVPVSLPPSSLTAACHAYAVPRSVVNAPYSKPIASASSSTSTATVHASVFSSSRPSRRLGRGASGGGCCPGGSPGGGAPGGCVEGWAETSVVMRGSCRSRFPSEGDAQSQIRPHTLVADAVSDVHVHRADRAAPARDDADAGIKDFFAPCIGGGADIEERGGAPVVSKPVLIFGRRRHEILGGQHRTRDVVTDALIAVAAHRIRTAGAKQQRSRNAARTAAREDAAEFGAQQHEVFLADRQILLAARVAADKRLVGQHALDCEARLDVNQIARARKQRVVGMAAGP